MTKGKSEKIHNKKIGLYFSYAFKNLINHKKQMALIAFGFIVSITVFFSILYWAETSEVLAINDFIEKQDYQSYIFSRGDYNLLEDMNSYLESIALVEDFSNSFTTSALFNTEGKDPFFYKCLPENQQTNMSDPISITNAFLVEDKVIQRIAFLFDIDGEFTTKNNGLLLSRYQANELSTIYGHEVKVGDVFNLSIARFLPNPLYGQDRLLDFNSVYYTNFTIRGVYTLRESVSLIQEALQLDWLADSIIFPLEQIEVSDQITLAENKVPSFIFIKFTKDILVSDGINNVIEKMNSFSENLKANFPSVFVYIFTNPIQTLQNTYQRATITIVLMIPAILLGIILTIFMVNVVLHSRKNEISLLQDRGAETKQILLLFNIEFVIVALVSIIFGILFAYIFAAFIPSLTTTGFKVSIFVKYFVNMKISPFITTIVSLGFLFLFITYVSFYIWWKYLRKNDSYFQDQNKSKLERNIFIGINIGTACIITLAIVFFFIDTLSQIQKSNTFTINNTLSAGYTFVLFWFLLFFFSQAFGSVISKKILPKLKRFYRLILSKDAFFLLNNFIRKDKKISTILFVLVLVSSIVTFTLITNSTVITNQNDEMTYKNGADLRILTYPINANFTTILAQFNGVEEVTPIFKTNGRVAENIDITLYGISPEEYSRIGNWRASSFHDNQTLEIFQKLKEKENGVIIGSELSRKLNLSIGQRLYIWDIPKVKLTQQFEIIGIINSAPGLGLADGVNIEMLQPNEGFFLINMNFLIKETKTNQCQLFLAHVLLGFNPTDVANALEATYPGIRVNPELINEQFTGAFIERYIPNVLVFLWIELIITVIIGMLLLIIYTDYTLNQRIQELAIKKSLGLSNFKNAKLILYEVVIITFSAAIGGIFIGILFSYAIFSIMIPLITTHNIIPFSIKLPFLHLIMYPIILIFIIILGILPTLKKYSKRSIIRVLAS